MSKHPLIPMTTPPAAGGGIRSVCVPGGHHFPLPPGFGPLGDDESEVEPIHKFTSNETLQALMEKIRDEPHLIQDNISLVTSDARDDFRNKFWPAIFDETQWTRVATHRPSVDAEGNKICGTDLTVREYENDYWMDNGRTLTAEVHTEFGEIVAINVKCQWN